MTALHHAMVELQRFCRMADVRTPPRVIFEFDNPIDEARFCVMFKHGLTSTEMLELNHVQQRKGFTALAASGIDFETRVRER